MPPSTLWRHSNRKTVIIVAMALSLLPFLFLSSSITSAIVPIPAEYGGSSPVVLGGDRHLANDNINRQSVVAGWNTSTIDALPYVNISTKRRLGIRSRPEFSSEFSSGVDEVRAMQHPLFGIWVSRLSSCNECVENCMEKHWSLFQSETESERLSAEDRVLHQRRKFYSQPLPKYNPSQLEGNPKLDPKATMAPTSYYREKNVSWRWPGAVDQEPGDEMYDALFGDPSQPDPVVDFNISDSEELLQLFKSGRAIKDMERISGFGGARENENRAIPGAPLEPYNLHTRRYIAKRLQQLADDTFLPWARLGGFTLEHHVNMVTCAFTTRMRRNPQGIWVHVVNNTATILRTQADTLGRTGRMIRYIHRVVSTGPPFPIPAVFYVSVGDYPCHPMHPYFNFFAKKGVRGIMIPDHLSSVWRKASTSLMKQAKSKTFFDRNNSFFFIGSPNVHLRMAVRDMLEASPYSNQTDIKIAVLEHKAFKHFAKPLAYHTNYRYLLSIRGRTASARDMYFTVMNSTIVRLEDDDQWFQFQHVLWEPYRHYVPLPVEDRQVMCAVSNLLGPPEPFPNKTIDIVDASWQWDEAKKRMASITGPMSKPHYHQTTGNYHLNERAAASMFELGRTLTQEVLDNYFRYTIRRYAEMQTYAAAPEAHDFVKSFRSFVRRFHSGVQVIPDDHSPVKFFFHKWLARRWKQIRSCRDPEFNKGTNGTMAGCVLYI